MKPVKYLTVALGLLITVIAFSPSLINAQQNGAGRANVLREPNAADKTKEPDDKKITICHVPPGNTGNPQTLTISINAWKTDGSGEGGHGPGRHGGDYIGPCLTVPGVIATAAPTQAAAAPTAATAASTAANTSNATAISVRPPWVAPVLAGPTCPDWLFYHSDRTGNLNIFKLVMPHTDPAVDVDVSKGSGGGVQDISPASSPDGKYAAFASNRDGSWEIYIGTADGSAQERVTYLNTALNVSPMWSPDGKSIIYESAIQGARNIFIANVATGQEDRLTDSAANDVNAFWSPDSQKVLFQTNRDGLWQIYEVTVASKALKRLSDGTSDDVNPQYSPDGKQIVFRSFPLNGTVNMVIQVMNADGSNRRTISDPNGNALSPAWSPDNSLIAYQSDLMGTGDIYVYQVASGITVKLTNSTTLNSAPTWICKTLTIVYTSIANGKPQLYQIVVPPISASSVSTSDSVQLTSDNATNKNPQSAPAVEDASQRTSEGNPVQ